jgi:superfamily II DNA or RNA helicase
LQLSNSLDITLAISLLGWNEGNDVATEQANPLEVAEKYRFLPEIDQTILKILSLFLAPVSSSTIANVLQKLDIRITPTRQIIPQDVSKIVAELIRLRLVLDEKDGILCHPSLRSNLIKMLDHQEKIKPYADAVLPFIRPQSVYGGYYSYRSYLHCLQHIRLAIFLRDWELAKNTLNASYKRYSYEMQQQHPFVTIFPEPLDAEFLLSLSSELLTDILQELCNNAFFSMSPSKSFDILEKFVTTRNDASPGTLYLHLHYKLMMGRIKDAETRLAAMESESNQIILGILSFLKGNDDAAISLFEKELIRRKKLTGKRKIFLPGASGFFHLLALIRSGLPHHLKTAVELAEMALKQDNQYRKTAVWFLSQLAECRLGNNRNLPVLEKEVNSEYQRDPFSQIITSLVAVWIKKPDVKVHSKKLASIRKSAEAADFAWIAAEAATLLKTINPDGKNDTAKAEKLYAEQGIMPLSGSCDSGNDWERSLKALLALATDTPAGKAAAQNATRLVWLITGGKNDSINIQPMEQKQKGKAWSAGRNIALKRLLDGTANTDFMTTQDLKIAACIRKSQTHGYYSQTCYDFDTGKALLAMVGHPLVFNAATEEQLSIARGEFTLKVDRQSKKLKLTISPLPPLDKTLFFCWEGASRLLVYETGKEQQRIAAILGEGLTVPLEGEKKIGEAISAIAPFVMIQSDVAGEDATVETVDPDSRIHILLRPFACGIMLELLVRPLGENGSGFFPGHGGATVIAAVSGKRMQTTRNLKTEKNMIQELAATSSTLDLYPSNDAYYRIPDPEGSLELLEELRELTIAHPDAFVTEWPEGEKLKLRGTATWNRVKVAVSSGKEWFSVEGSVAISDDDVLSLQQLLELSTMNKGRFIQLADGEFVALTEEFRRKLDELRHILDRHGKENRFHPLAATLLEDALHGAGSVKGDKLWKTTLERFKSAEAFEPKLPPTFQATLRDYQLEGFDWLSRLAHWGVGACLADDMGLGKTIQALALLVDRAPQGASLVLAPTSVCLNWESECIRFAPTLVPRIFGGGNRKEFIKSLQPFYLAICSYTLFQQEAELMTSVDWNTVILDEAQAIKNMATKRSQAAMQLKAGFRIATTGTPVENRLDELWNLYRFLNPGLLGSHKSFTERFSTPIERDGDKNARTLLKKLIRPFILRRTKSQVLQELPPRTDILHRVELSREEMALYEALRRKAVETLQGGDGQGEGERQIRILAEIMRLRRACCNPVLVMPGSDIASAKLAAFREIVDELRANGHRALVFSQFVDHLSLVRASLDADKITYQYLDGSTPVKTRQEQVAAFQRGEGELFLISLKAGGTGLNLTAADYVIHLDPWWNPAVEDQASDRAHRIGQLRPVTVYRLVAANTIEEKIVALHHQKRDLADSLLEGTESAARVSADDLMELLREVG